MTRPAAPVIEYEDRIVRYPGVGSYRLIMRGPADVAIVDGFGGRTIARVRLGADGELEITGEDVDRGREVATAWVAWCRREGKPVW